jgi:hypothetical protein
VADEIELGEASGSRLLSKWRNQWRCSLTSIATTVSVATATPRERVSTLPDFQKSHPSSQNCSRSQHPSRRRDQFSLYGHLSRGHDASGRGSRNGMESECRTSEEQLQTLTLTADSPHDWQLQHSSGPKCAGPDQRLVVGIAAISRLENQGGRERAEKSVTAVESSP